MVVYSDSIFINEPSSINITSLITNTLVVLTSDGSIDISVSGGTGAYSYSWQ